MPHVTHTAEGWQVGADVHASLRDALDAALATVATFEKPSYFRGEDGEEIGVYRWLPAVAEEAKALRGVRLDAQAVEEMAMSLNDATRAIPIDGGSDDSPPHGTAIDPSTKANGRGHWMVTATNAAGETEGYLWAELLPTIAVDVDLGRLGEGSAHFRWGRLDGECPRDVEYASHALLNDPGIVTLAPANSVRDAKSVLRSVPMAGRSMRSAKRSLTRAAGRGTTMKTTLRAKLIEAIAKNLPAEAKRGPALDKLAEIASALGVDIDAEMSSDSWDSPVASAVSALKSMASAEKVLEGLPAKEPAADADAEAARAKMAARSAVIAAALGLAEDASDEDIVAAIEKLKPAADADPTKEPAPGAEVEAARAAVGSLRSEVSALRATVAELEPLRLEKIARDRTDAIDAAMAVRGVAPAQRPAFLAHAEKYGTESAIAAIELAHVPPVGSPIPAGAARSRAAGAPEALATGECTDANEATERAQVAVRAEQPTLSGAPFHRAVLARARLDHPKAFSRSAAKN